MAITYGMSVKEFWEESPDLFWAYRFSYYNKLENEHQMVNNSAWLQGAYFYEAISVALGNVFGKEKLYYSKQPYGGSNEEPKKEDTLNNAVIELKGRISQVQAIWKNKEKSSTTDSNKVVKKENE